MAKDKQTAEIYRAWSREAPAHFLNEFLSDFDAGSTQLELTREKRRFIVEIVPLPDNQED